MTTEQKINKIISEQLGVKLDDITGEKSFIDDLGADSLDMVELTMSIEDEFAIEITDETLDSWSKVGDVYGYFNEDSQR